MRYLLALGLLCGTSAVAVEGPEDLAQRIVAALDAATATCPVETRGYDAVRVVTCLQARSGPSQVKELVDATAAGVAVATPRGDWAKSDVAVRRFFDYPATMLAVEYFTTAKRIVISYPKPVPYCGSTEPLPDMPDVERPHVIPESQQIKPYPEVARPTRIDITIALKGVVQTDGALRDLCVVPTRWKGQLGFEFAAYDSVKSWRYVPAKRGEEPVEAPIVMTVRFRP